ncbi:hypothetical protein ACFTUC_17455 [Streptomyces sp. NPDC056944]|uniref:hypothetical protein n=1 Tax=Streptomyces sp. NPDC056944 TaxID=3345972 RepID=UPI00362AE236
MQVKRSKHTKNFVIVPNDIPKHRKLSLTAKGLLTLLLSQPEWTDETIKSLTADEEEGQARVTAAVKQLQAAGYVVITNRQNDMGHWYKVVTVYDRPATAAPKPEEPKIGTAKPRTAGPVPSGDKNEGKNPPRSPKDADEVADSSVTDGDGGDAPKSSNEPTAPEEIGRAAALLGRLDTAAPSLALSAADVMSLAPLAAEWLRRDVSELQLRNELTEGLPARIQSPRALLADRLTRKLPALPVKVEPMAECDDCGTYFPRGQEAGVCGRCADAVPSGREPLPVGQTDDAASLLAEIQERRASGRIKGTSRRGFATVAA